MKNGDRLEDFLESGTPKSDVMYLHSWRFNSEYTFDSLDACLARLNGLKLNLGCKQRKLPGFDNLDKDQGWLFQNGLDYPDGSVKGITISHALMFLTDSELDTFMEEMWRVLAPGGVVRITEDETEEPRSEFYKTGNVRSGPKCLTGPNMMRRALERVGFNARDVARNRTHFTDRSLMQAYRGGGAETFFIEGIKI